MNAAVVMDGTSADVCKEQRLLEENQLLDIGSGESEADDVDALVMDIDDDDDMLGNRPKPSGVGTENLTSLDTNSSDSCITPKPPGVGTENSTESNTNSSGSGIAPKPPGVGTVVQTSSTVTTNQVGTSKANPGIDSSVQSANSHNTRPPGVGTVATTEPVTGNTTPLGVCTVNQLSTDPGNEDGTGKTAQTHSGVGTAAASASTMAEARDGTNWYCTEPFRRREVPLLHHRLLIQWKSGPHPAAPHILGFCKEDECHDQL